MHIGFSFLMVLEVLIKGFSFLKNRLLGNVVLKEFPLGAFQTCDGGYHGTDGWMVFGDLRLLQIF